MKIGKKTIIYIVLFVFLLSFFYLVISSFFSSSLRFKSYFTYDEIINDNELEISYLVNDKDQIILAYQKDEKIYISEITHDDEKAKNIMHIDISSYDRFYMLKQYGNYYYLFLNSKEKIIKIDLLNKTYECFEFPLSLNIIINEYDNNFYLYEDNKLYLLIGDEKILKYTLPDKKINAKEIFFTSESTFFIATYDGKIYYYDNLNVKESTNICTNYFYYQKKMYYTYYIDNKKMGICYFDGKDEIAFQIPRTFYLSFIVKGDYLYLIDKDNIYKVCISRKKRQEKLVMGKYENMDYNLENILIINDKMMYLPMKKKIDENSFLMQLYRYKI
ncbi:MAG: hypothetical protein MR270_00880 [Erysipelotrichaceae bacterium]|nr:hypothetical protein [Erysipelotrichaceae bacterium]